MTISEFIKALQAIQTEHGDLQVAVMDRAEEYRIANVEVDLVDKYGKGDFEIQQKVAWIF